MTTRTEPSVGTTQFSISEIFSKKAKHHSELLDEALSAFTDAQAKLDYAQATISGQIEADEREVALRQGKILAATESHSRLERIKGRFADLLA